jgi:hypothetical protein
VGQRLPAIADTVCANDTCDVAFPPRTITHKYCSRRCKSQQENRNTAGKYVATRAAYKRAHPEAERRSQKRMHERMNLARRLLWQAQDTETKREYLERARTSIAAKTTQEAE